MCIWWLLKNNIQRMANSIMIFFFKKFIESLCWLLRLTLLVIDKFSYVLNMWKLFYLGALRIEMKLFLIFHLRVQKWI
jgi:hypothetical protein